MEETKHREFPDEYMDIRLLHELVTHTDEDNGVSAPLAEHVFRDLCMKYNPEILLCGDLVEHAVRQICLSSQARAEIAQMVACDDAAEETPDAEYGVKCTLDDMISFFLNRVARISFPEDLR